MSRPGSRFQLVGPALTVALATAFTLRPIDDFDVWYHLAAGRLMWTTGRWPATNTFAYTTPEHPWVDLHWLFQLVLYAMHAALGPDGCIALALLLILCTLGLLYRQARQSASPVVVALLLGWALVLASPRLVPRPELVGFALLAVFLRLLEGHPANGRALYWAVPLQVVWMNAHGTVPLGLLLVGCYWVGATLAFLPLPRGWQKASGGSGAAWRRLTGVLLLVGLACLATPWGVGGARLPLDLLADVSGGTALSGRIGEFRPPFQSGYGLPLAYAWAAFLGLALLSFGANVRALHLGRLLSVGVLGFLSTRALRNVAPFAWAAVPAIAANCGALTLRPALRGMRILAVAIPLALTALIWSVVTNRFAHGLGLEREFGLGVSRLHAPIDAVAFAKRVGIGGRPFNCFASGGYLAWARYPAERVFVDGRTQAYPAPFFDLYFHVMDDPEAWPEIVARYAPDYVLLYHVWPNRHPLASYLADGHGWTIVYYDPTASLYVPTDEAHRGMRERATQAFAELQKRSEDAPDGTPPQGLLGRIGWLPVGEIRRQTALGDFLLAIGRPDRAVSAYHRALALDPDIAATRFSFGLAYWLAGQPEAAVREWRETLRRHPEFAPAQDALAAATQ